MIAQRSSIPHPLKRGFTLIELMTVIAIMAILVAISSPAISYLTKSKSFSSDVQQIADLARNAQAIARSENTYVRMGFCTLTPSGSSDKNMYVILLKSTDGNEPYTTSPTPNYNPASKPVLCHRIDPQDNYNYISNAISALQNIDSQTGTANAFNNDSSDTTNVSINSQTLNFTNFISFHPDGSVYLQGDASTYKRIFLPLLQQYSKNNRNVAAIEISGLTGNITIYQP